MDKSSNNNKLWQSFEKLNKENSGIETGNEFLPETLQKFNLQETTTVSRRKFFALLTASAALTATACTDYRQKGNIIPYTKRPEEVLPGTANYYSSTCTGCSQNCGTLIKTREGRPIKIDGNPENPINKGKICSTGQASILNLYDPSRLKNPVYNGKEILQQDFDSKIIDALNDCNKNNLEIAFISNTINSPVVLSIINDFKAKYPSLKQYTYELFNESNYIKAINKCYGQNYTPKIEIDKAKIILSIEADFLGKGNNSVEDIRLFTKNRDVYNIDNFCRLYCIEGNYSLTGSNADYRIGLNTNHHYEFLLSLANELIFNKGLNSLNLNSNFLALIKNYTLGNFVKKYKLNYNIIKTLTDDLITNKSESLIIADRKLSEEVQIVVNLLNDLLNKSALMNFNEGYKKYNNLSSYDDFYNLTQNTLSGKVGMIINFDCDPVYHLPIDLNFEKALQKAKYSVTFCESVNDTSEASIFVCPINNQLESWGIFNRRAEVYSFQQPVISPIFTTRQKEAVILYWLSGGNKLFDEFIYHKYLIEFCKINIYPKVNSLISFDSFWNNCLHDGILELSTPISVSSNSFNTNALNDLKPVINNSSISVLLEQSYFIGDGKYANNGWLQEIPHPISKIVWDNYAAISPAFAQKHNLELNDVIEIKANHKKIKIGVCVQPGIADNLIVIELGYGRNIIGEVGNEVGVNANILLQNSFEKNYLINNVSIVKTGETYKFASSQEHHAIDDKMTKDLHLSRNIIQEGTLLEYKKNPNFLEKNKTELFSITSEIKYTGVKWGMSIDLNKCIGCAVCVSSCNVENNIPIVGKDQCDKGREMQWMRIDRYYSGEPEAPILSNQPMLCQHCDNAPCENVCPVNATNHSDDGLSQMTYNRCVGTRYCSNNCPYKVRRFNFFNFRDNFEEAYYDNELTGLMNNPEVTVRSRGVMEKCTFCVQKIMEARQEAIKLNIPLKGSDVITACQQACPSEAIVFGDVNDKNSEVSKNINHKLGYHVLEALNIKPNVTYIAKLRNIQSEEI